MKDPWALKVPFLGEGIDAVTVATWLVHAGDAVHAGQDIVELSADKAIFYLPSSQRGVLQKILVAEGGQVKAGETLALIATS